ncbi:MAG: NAD(P)H-quinone oxidoreductase [Methylobacter sp.]|nr:MAG: NAD(P)H-quinone oxidoreductase [Methylobacter sp.]
MLAIEIDNQTLQPASRPQPEPRPDEVLIKVAAAGVNRPDVMQRQGLYPAPPGATDIPGLEIAGSITATGDQVTQFKPGDQVCALVSGGGYAEYCTAPASLCLPIPSGLSAIEAAGLPETFFTVWSNVFDRAGLKPQETLLVHGGGSGIGTTAIQLAHAFGAHVFTTAGSDEKCAFCLELGAKAAINYRSRDFVEIISRLTDGKGVNVILDIIGGDYFPRNLKCLSADGRLVQIALQNGVKSEINLLPVMLKRLTITGSTLRIRDTEFKAAIARQLKAKVWPLLEQGSIKPVIHSTFKLTEAGLAHALMESNRHTGKIILTVD